MGSREEAEKLMQEGQKLIKPSVLAFRLKPEWMQATPLFERAALIYRRLGDLPSTRQALELSATGHERQHSIWHAAKCLDKAGEAARDQRDWQGAEELTMRAAELYLQAGRPAAAAEAAARAARALEAGFPEGAFRLHTRGLDWAEDSGTPMLAADAYRAAAAAAQRAGRPADAVRVLLRLAAVADAAGQRNALCKSQAAAVVAWMAAGEAGQAWAVWQDCLAVEAFAGSEEAQAVQGVLLAYAEGPGAVRAAVKKHTCLQFLDNAFARAAKTLPVGDCRAQAALLDDKMGRSRAPEVGEEEDLT